MSKIKMSKIENVENKNVDNKNVELIKIEFVDHQGCIFSQGLNFVSRHQYSIKNRKIIYSQLIPIFVLSFTVPHVFHCTKVCLI